MESIVELMVRALTCAAEAEEKGIGNDRVTEARDTLHEEIGAWFSHKNNPVGTLVLEKFKENPAVWENPLREILTETGVGKSPETVHALIVLVDVIEKSPEGKKLVGTYNLTVSESMIGVLGDNAKIAGGVHFHYSGKADPSAMSKKWRRRYLLDLASETNHLPWVNVDPDYADPKRGEALGLVDVYTATDTSELEKPDSEEAVRKYLKRQKEARRISSQEMIDREKRLVVLGDPGSGKSTLVNFLAFVMANAGLGEGPAWLDRLKKNGPWRHGALLPVRVVLREFVAWLSPDIHTANASVLTDYLEDRMRKTEYAEFWTFFHDTLVEPGPGGSCLILLDGLDEVPMNLRQVAIKTIDAFVKKYGGHRYVVTCRIYAYVGQDNQLEGFHSATLMPFTEDQIKNFISAWYAELAERGRFTKADAQDRAERLKNAATRPDLIGLAERPLLTSVMALLHTFRGQLPEDRIALYRWTVDLLLRRWESRMGRDKGVLEVLNIPGLKMGSLEDGLYDVAFHAHAAHGGEEVADIGEGMLRERLAAYLCNDWNKAGEFVDYVRERAGLLIRHKPNAYTFPHRTFQEFMAACHLIGMTEYPTEAANLVRSDPGRWRVVYVLAAGGASRGQGISAVNALCPVSVEKIKNPDTSVFNHSRIAAEALLEIGLEGACRDDFGQAVLDRIRDWLVAAMQRDALFPASERVALGNTLSRLGDPRFEPKRWYLPNDENLGFVEIPPGKFSMGSVKKKDKQAYDDETPHTVELSGYALAKYPVTKAQFRAFVRGSGYETDGKFEKYGEDNHPVVFVSWNDAIAYCEWLSEQLKDRCWQITLPTEAQWEKASRGNDGRIYPYGNVADKEKMNFDETGIGTTSPVGCFPGGASPYGLDDMSGNVWEWCLDRCEWDNDKSMVVTDTYIDGIVDPVCEIGSVRVIRGGYWGDDARYCRSACRNHGAPSDRYVDLGFRLLRSVTP